MFVASSRTLLGRSCQRRCWPLPRLARAEPSPINFNSESGAEKNNFSLQNSPHFAFSTISFDDNTFDSIASPSWSESVDSQHTSLKQPSIKNKTTTSQVLDDTPSSQKFQQKLQQWISTNPKIAPYKAEEYLARLWVEQQNVFQQWEQQQKQMSSSNMSVSPPAILLTAESVNLVLQAWCCSNNGEIAAKRAERLLHWMEDLHVGSDLSQPAWSSWLPKPNYQSYATVIDAWSRSAVYESSHAVCISSSNDMETKSGGRTKNVISPATEAGFECAKHAEDLLMHMQRMYEKQMQIAEENGQSEHYNSEIQPDTRLFNLVLTAWSKIHGGTKASATRAMRILDLMQELYHYQSMNAPEWQGIVLSKVQPNLQTYKLVLHAWAHAAHTADGPDRAEEILRHLLSMSKAGNSGVEIMPDVECFHIVMKAHAESVRKRRKGDDGSAPAERARKVSALLDWMELLALRITTSKIQPTTESYRIALSAWVWSRHVDAPKEAENILYRMIRACNIMESRDAIIVGDNDASVKNKSDSCAVWPETRDFNTLINCCSFARTVGADKSEEDDESLLQRQLAHQEIFTIAEGVLDALLSSKYAEADPATFAGIIRACVNLLPNTDQRDGRVIELFRQAYHTPPSVAPPVRISSASTGKMRAPPGAGCVDANVLRQLRLALPSTEDYIRVREKFEEHRSQTNARYE